MSITHIRCDLRLLNLNLHMLHSTFLQAPDQSSAWTQLGDAIDTNYSYFAMAADRPIVAVRRGKSVLIYNLSDDFTSWTPMADAIDPLFTLPDDYLQVFRNS